LIVENLSNACLLKIYLFIKRWWLAIVYFFFSPLFFGMGIKMGFLVPIRMEIISLKFIEYCFLFVVKV
ncbi:MAG TPA: hypothetical protein VGD26_11285, partial [Chitinophagaceae bacterium]